MQKKISESLKKCLKNLKVYVSVIWHVNECKVCIHCVFFINFIEKFRRFIQIFVKLNLSGLAAAASFDPKEAWLHNSSGNSICNSFEAQCKIAGTVYFGALLKKKQWKYELLNPPFFLTILKNLRATLCFS